AGAVLMDEPRDLVRMADEVRRKFRPDRQVDGRTIALAQIEEAPGGGMREDLVLRIPLEGDAHQLGLVAMQAELPYQLADVVFGAPLDEGDLGFADDDAHRTRWSLPGPVTERTPSLVLGPSPHRKRQRTKYVTRSAPTS